MRVLVLAALLLPAAPAAAQKGGELKDQKAPKFDRDKSGKEAGVPGKALDLGSLLGGPSVPGPAAGPTAPSGGSSAGGFEREKRALRAAVEQLSGPGRKTVAKFYDLAFGGTDAAPKVLEADIQKAGADILAMIDAGRIVVEEGEQMGSTAAYWEATMKGEPAGWVGGKLGVSRSAIEGTRRAHALTPQRPGISLLCAEDQLGNTILHEAAHIFYSWLRERKKLEPAESWVPDVPAQQLKDGLVYRFAQTHFWNGAGPALFCTDRGCQSAPQCVNKTERYEWKLDGIKYSAKANENAARMISSRLQSETQGGVLRPILEALFASY